MRAAKKYKVATQVGNQGHSSSGAAQFKQMVEMGCSTNRMRCSRDRRRVPNGLNTTNWPNLD